MNILIIGGGSIGKRHLKNLRQLGYNQLWVLRRSPDPSFEETHGVKVLTSFEAAGQESLDAVFICTPTALHHQGLQFAIDHQLHIFMEKPLIHNASGLEKAINAMNSFNGIFFIGFMLRYHPLVKEIKKIIDSRKLGDVYSARFEFGSFLPYWHPWEDYKISYASQKALGGGVINTITHELDLIQYFFGPPLSIYCQKDNFGQLDIDVEEQCEAIFQYDNKTVTLHLDYLQKDYDRNIKILCREGKICWNWHENKVSLTPHKLPEEVIEIPTSFEVNDLYIDEIKHFFEIISTDQKQHGLDFPHAITNTELMLLMHSSAEQNQKLSYTKS